MKAVSLTIQCFSTELGCMLLVMNPSVCPSIDTTFGMFSIPLTRLILKICYKHVYLDNATSREVVPNTRLHIQATAEVKSHMLSCNNLSVLYIPLS